MPSTKVFKKPENPVSHQHRSVPNPIKVFCRLKPLNSSNHNYGAYIKDFTKVVLSSQGTSASQKSNFEQETQFVFKQVFDPSATQTYVFNLVAYPLVERLVRGQNSLLFTYGVTGSGKTYTMTGDSSQCGIMPRCLNLLFRSISSRHAEKYTFQSDHLNGFEIATAKEIEIRKRQILEKVQRTPLSTPRAQLGSLRRKNSEQEFDIKNLGPPIVVLGVKEENVYAVFISYIEVYNNSVYDLLEEGPVQKTLESHIVREDADHNMYVHGATELEITSVQEAMEAFQLGQKRKRMGQTILNTESSRGHSVFNIRLVQTSISRSKEVIVSQLSLVDLAGSERSARTKNTGARLREAGNINNSLMTLRTCLEYLRENQQAPVGTMAKQIPYRDSKITQLFKNFFQGEGQVCMIVCINPRIEDYLENAQVLKFAEMTQGIQICTPKPNYGNLNSGSRKIVNKENAVLKERNKTNIDFIPPQQKKIDIDRRLDLYHKRVLELEAQNSELRKEVEMLRRTHKTFVPGARKALTERQKSTVVNDKKLSETENLHRQKTQPVFQNNLKNGERGYENELKKKLLERRQKLENLEKNHIETKRSRISKSLKNLDSKIDGCNNEDNYKLTEQMTINGKTSKLTLCKQQSISIQTLQILNNSNMKCNETTFLISPIQSRNNLNSRQSISAAPILQNNLQYRNCIDSNKTIIDENSKLFPLMLITPKVKMSNFKHSTPLVFETRYSRKKLNFDTPQSFSSMKCSLFQKDNSFDKREQELSLKIAEHRKKLTENQRVVELLQSFKRTKSSICLFNNNRNDRHEGSKDRRCSLSDG